MITPAEAEQLANKTITEYVNACRCDTTEDAANALMKLASMCGLAMCAVAGQKDAVDRMQGTTNYIARPEHAGPWKRSTVQ